MDINLLTSQELQLLRQIIDESDKIVICVHKSPDGDALGSSLAWAEYLRMCGKSPGVVIPDAYPDFLQWLPNTEKLVRFDRRPTLAKSLMEQADVIFCLDFNTPSRLEALAEAFNASAAKKVLFDHHLSPDIPAVLSVSHPALSSASEIVFRIIWQLGDFEKMNKKIAVPLYCGIMTDTNSFMHSSSYPEIYFIVAQLLTKRINKDKIYHNVYNTFSEHRLRMTGYVLSEKLKVFPDLNASYFVLTRAEMRRFHYIKGDSEGLVNMPLQIKATKLSIPLREDTLKDNLIWISLRSVDDFPCNEMAEQFFNGGGHRNASGGRLYCSVAEAEGVVSRALEAWRGKLEE